MKAKKRLLIIEADNCANCPADCWDQDLSQACKQTEDGRRLLMKEIDPCYQCPYIDHHFCTHPDLPVSYTVLQISMLEKDVCPLPTLEPEETR
jgi:hypothetical protein